jgi:energy-coupling factor transporter ATP-binding protein EcfA2
MHVARLRITGIRGFYGERSVDLNFRRPDGSLAGWTVLAGRNGSGKSTVLQALALALSGPRSTSFIPSLADLMSTGVAAADVKATLDISAADARLEPLPSVDADITNEAWIHFDRRVPFPSEGPPPEPQFHGRGIDSLTGFGDLSTIRPHSRGWLYAGYGPFRHLGMDGSWRSRRSRASKLAIQVASLFDETMPLTDAIDWLIEQHLLRFEGRPGAERLLDVMMTLLGDGLLPDGFHVLRVDSEGLWVTHGDIEFPLREMSDGYRAVTALVVDIVRQMSIAFGDLIIADLNGTPVLPLPGVILIDEIDAHLHVNWQKTIGTWLKTHFPAIQFIVTTHSPYICQSADPAGLILLPGPGDNHPPHIVDDEVYERVIYGSADDAVLTELFGVKFPYSDEARRLRQALVGLEEKIYDGTATPVEKQEYRRISELLTSSTTARVSEIAAQIRHEP